MRDRPIFFKVECSKIDPERPMNPEIQILAKHDGTYYPLMAILEYELDTRIDHLITELESIRQEAKRKFAAAKLGRG